MPFRALRDGEIVVPAMIPNQEPVFCPACGDKMYVRNAEGRARHFVHNDGGEGGCAGPSDGESSTHARCVALAVAELKERFGAKASLCAAEVDVDVSMSGSGQQVRRADALVELKSEMVYFGDGIIVEVQHKHHDKDINATTHDYLSAGYSVVWLSSSDFGEEELDSAVFDRAFESREGLGYAQDEYSPSNFLQCQAYAETGEHDWGTVPSYVLTCEEEYEICTAPVCTIRRQYDEEQERYDYNQDSIVLPDLPINTLRRAIVDELPIEEIEGWLAQWYGTAMLEKALADRSEIGPCTGPKGFHEWGEVEPVWETYSGMVKVGLRACHHCPVHLLSDFREDSDGKTHIHLSRQPDPEWELLGLKSDPRQCDHRVHSDDSWYEFCPDCGVTSPN